MFDYWGNGLEDFEEAVSKFPEKEQRQVELRMELLKKNYINFGPEDLDSIANGTFDARPTAQTEPTTESLSKPKIYNRTDIGNAERLVEHWKGEIRFCVELNCWLIWDGIRWLVDDGSAIDRRAIEMIKAMSKEAITYGPDEERRALLGHALYSERSARINSMIKLARVQDGIPIALNDLDTDPMLLNCKNGTLDLRTGILLPHRKEDLITRLVHVDYDPEAICPIWYKFLSQITKRDFDLQSYLNRLAGYCLTGKTSEQTIWIFYGEGANGKSTFIETLRVLLQEYAKQADFTSFKKKKFDGIRNDLARIKGARLFTAVETGKGDYLDEVLIKRITGQDTITARFLHKEFFEFKNNAKVIIAANDLPKIRGKDHAIWRRVKIVPFSLTIPSETMDRDLPEKLRGELPGILAWAVRGCIDWQILGLVQPQEVTDASDSFRRDMDTVPTFVKEMCRTGYELKVKKSVLWNSYRKWCFEKKVKAASRTDFRSEMLEQGFSETKISVEYYTGLDICSDAGVDDVSAADDTDF